MLPPSEHPGCIIVPACFALLLFSAGATQAQNLSYANSYNVFIFGDMTESNVDSEGRVAVGRDANLTNYGVGSSFQNSPASAGNTLVVGGNLNYNGGEIEYGNAIYGGTFTGSVAAPHGTLSKGTLIDFSAAKNQLTSSSTYWASLSATGSTINNYGTVNLVGTRSDVNIFSLSGALLSAASGISIDAPAGSSVLINIDGQTNSFQNMGIEFKDINGDHTGSTNKQRVLYNFYQSSSLTIGGISVQGSLLAPFATVNFGNGNIEGTLIANGLSGSGEAHNYLFNGSLPAVPEPSSLGLLAAGLLSTWGFGRNRKAES